MTTYYVDINVDYNVADPSHDGSISNPFCYSECDTLVGGAAVNGYSLINGDMLRLRGIYDNSANLFQNVAMSLIVKSWPNREPWRIQNYSSSPASEFSFSGNNLYLRVYDGIIDSIYGNITTDNCSLYFYNCLSWGIEFNSAGTSSYYRLDNCTIDGYIWLYDDNGDLDIVDMVMIDGYIQVWDSWNTIDFTGRNIFNNTQVTVDQTGATPVTGWNTCSFSYDIADEIPAFDDDFELEELSYLNFDLPVITSQPSRWNTIDVSEGWRNEFRYGYGAFYFPFDTNISASPESGTGPLEVDFTANADSDLVDENNGYSWDFGDGETSSEKDPTHTYIPGEYNACVTITALWGVSVTQCITIYVYENDYSPGGRNVTKTTRIYRFGIPQEKKQGTGWSEYNGVDYPNAIGLIGTCKLFTTQDEERVIVTDCNTFKHYWLGREDHWVDGENEDYGGTQIESDILFRENVPSDSPTAKLRHSESSANLKPWFKDRRNIGNYGAHGFTNDFLASMYFRTDSSPVDRAVVRYFRRRAQIVSDRHIEDESIQSGLRLVGAPWRLVDVEQWYQEIDTAAAPDEKQMSEKTWNELLSNTIIWIGRSIDLVNIDDGSHTMPWDKGSNQRTTGSFTGISQGPDGNDRSAIALGTGDSISINESIPSGSLSIIMWVRSPVSSCTIMSNANLTIQLVQVDGEWELRFDDGTNDFTVPLTSQLTDWTMITLVRHGNQVDIYENSVISNTRYLSQNLSYTAPIVFFSGQCIGFEPRIIGAALTANAVRFIYNDVIENHGNTTCAMY